MTKGITRMVKYSFSLITASALVLMAGAVNADIYDLSSDPGGVDALTVSGDGRVGSAANFEVYVEQPAGTGYIDPFLRTHVPGQSEEGAWCATGGGTLDGRCEQGYNTDGRPVEFDTKDENQWTKSLLLSDLQITSEGYVEFLLDINQDQGGAGEDQQLSLDELQFFVTTDPNLLGYDDVNNRFIDDVAGVADNVALAWELDRYQDWNPGDDPPGEDDYILLENCKAPGTCGSGDYDMLAQIAYQDFIDAALGTGDSDSGGIVDYTEGDELYVVLFNRFGDNQGEGRNNPGSNDGFEEWSGVLFTAPEVPEPAVASLLFAGLVGVWATRRRRRSP